MKDSVVIDAVCIPMAREGNIYAVPHVVRLSANTPVQPHITKLGGTGWNDRELPKLKLGNNIDSIRSLLRFESILNNT